MNSMIRQGIICSNFFRLAVQGNDQHGSLAIDPSNLFREPFDLRFLRAGYFQDDGIFSFAAVIAGDGLKRETIKFFGDHANHGPAMDVFGIDAMDFRHIYFYSTPLRGARNVPPVG